MYTTMKLEFSLAQLGPTALLYHKETHRQYMSYKYCWLLTKVSYLLAQS